MSFEEYIRQSHCPTVEFDPRKAGRFEPIYSKKQRDPETKPDRVEPRESRSTGRKKSIN